MDRVFFSRSIYRPKKERNFVAINCAVLRVLKLCFVDVEDVAAFSQQKVGMKEILNVKEYTGRNPYKT